MVSEEPELAVSLPTPITEISVTLRAGHVVTPFSLLDVDLEWREANTRKGYLSHWTVKHGPFYGTTIHRLHQHGSLGLPYQGCGFASSSRPPGLNFNLTLLGVENTVMVNAFVVSARVDQHMNHAREDSLVFPDTQPNSVIWTVQNTVQLYFL